MPEIYRSPVQNIRFNPYFFVSLFYLLLLHGTQTLAHDISEFDVTEKDSVFYIKASMVLHAPASYVHAVLTDYIHIYRLNPSIIESEILSPPDENTARIRTKVIGCVLSYCQELERVEDVHILPSGTIQALIVPQLSQFKSGTTLWQIQARGKHSKLSYYSEIEPDFFIPPILGATIVKNKLREELTSSFSLLEKIAIIQSERDWSPDRRFNESIQQESEED